MYARKQRLQLCVLCGGHCKKLAVFQFAYSGQFLYFVIGQKAGFLSASAKEF
jgi:hypothetical protein